MKCEDEDCERDAVGTDIVGAHRCADHLEFSALVNAMCIAELDQAGHPDFVPDEVRPGRN